MKKNLHPEVYKIDARCVCGATYPVESTNKDVVVSFCAQCHPFYTNKVQFADIEGRIDKFNKKYKTNVAK